MPAATKSVCRASSGVSLPLPTLLSQALVAFIIEFDNEFEHRMPTRTMNRPATRSVGPWLTSMAMWSTCMRFVGEHGVTVRELQRLARTPTNLHGMQRWRYVTVCPDPADPRPKPPQADWLIQPTPAGRLAQEIWRPLFSVVEDRWQERFGKAQIEHLREFLIALARQFAVALPDCMPILHYGLFSKNLDHDPEPAKPNDEKLSGLPLPGLLSRVLLAFALDFERDAHPGSALDLSLAICANVLRVLNDEGVRLRDLPRLSGVSKEAIAMALSYLEKRRYLVAKTDPRFCAVGCCYRRSVEGVLRRGHRSQSAQFIGAYDGRSSFPRFGALSRRLESVGGQDRDTAALSDGVASRRLPRRQLNPHQLRLDAACHHCLAEPGDHIHFAANPKLRQINTRLDREAGKRQEQPCIVRL
jgi:hypothetical protein